MGTFTTDVASGTDVVVNTTTETVVATLPGVTTGRKTTVTLEGWVQLTVGTATTGLTLRVRRGVDATGTLVGEANLEIVEGAAGSTEDHEINVQDPGVDLQGQTYVLTVQQTAATGNGTGVQSSLKAITKD